MGSGGCRQWSKSSFCANDKDCVEVWFGGGTAHVRNSSDRQGPVLVFNRGEWETFLLGAFNGEFEMPI
ncbi:hypothetical protein ABH926_004534 [Catenulispora sp. GP43]|uniref:DUF397 domain-containing protein n=1 Tax=Catenulispora sp. GP43 TaxID=3156263 RepID=UPI003518A5C6